MYEVRELLIPVPTCGIESWPTDAGCRVLGGLGCTCRQWQDTHEENEEDEHEHKHKNDHEDDDGESADHDQGEG